MVVALQIRDVPEDVRDAIAQRAARQGQSVQAYLLDLVQREARMLRNAAAFERTAGSRIVIPDGFTPEQIIREGRDGGFAVDRDAADRDAADRDDADPAGAAAAPR
jgi:plasmid stability protein